MYKNHITYVSKYIMMLNELHEYCARLKKWGIDSYLYAPKDDYKHRAYWRDLYTVEEAEHLTGLITAAREYGITFYYALSPGLDITYSSSKEVTALKRKLEQVSQFGCTAFALLFDDIEPEMSEADKEVFQSFAHAQVRMQFVYLFGIYIKVLCFTIVLVFNLSHLIRFFVQLIFLNTFFYFFMIFGWLEDMLISYFLVKPSFVIYFFCNPTEYIYILGVNFFTVFYWDYYSSDICSHALYFILLFITFRFPLQMTFSNILANLVSFCAPLSTVRRVQCRMSRLRSTSILLAVN